MNNYLLHLLKEIKTIIIPGLGALTVTNEATGEIMFMPYLKYDDGTLAKHIAEKEGMDLNDAKNLIAKFVREVTIELDKGESYDMYQFGKFSKVDGEVAFDQWNSASETEVPKAPEKAPVIESVVSTPVVETPKKEEPKATEKAPLEEKIPVIESVVTTPTVEAPKKEEPKAEEPKAVAPKEAEPTKVETLKVETPKVETPKVETPKVEVQTITPLVEKTEKKVSEKSIEKAAEPVKPIVPIHTKSEEKTVESTTPKAEEKAAPKLEAEKTAAEKVVPVTPTAEIKVEKTVEAKPTPAKPASPTAGISPKEQLKKVDAQKAKQTDTPKKKTSVLSYIIWGVLVLLLGGGTYVAVNFSSLKKDFPILADLAGDNEEPKDSTNLKTLENDDPSANPDSLPIAEPIPEEEVEQPEVAEPEPVVTPEPTPAPAPKPVVKPTPKPVATPKPVSPKPVVNRPLAKIPATDSSNPYHIIAGSFSSEKNALRLARELKGRGMAQISVGQSGGVYRVSVKGYNTKEEAIAALPSVKSIAADAWVYNWK